MTAKRHRHRALQFDSYESKLLLSTGMDAVGFVSSGPTATAILQSDPPEPTAVAVSGLTGIFGAGATARLGDPVQPLSSSIILGDPVQPLSRSAILGDPVQPVSGSAILGDPVQPVSGSAILGDPVQPSPVAVQSGDPPGPTFV